MTSSGVPGDDRVRGDWLAAAAASLAGDLEGRVHGGHPSGAISPFFTDSSISSKDKEASTSSLLGDIDAYLNHVVSGELLWNHKLRLTRYLAAAKLLLMLQRQLPFVTASGDIHGRVKKLLDKAMSFLAMEFCHLRIWTHDVLLREHQLGISPLSIWESVRRSCRDSSNSGSVVSSSSASFSGSSSGLHSAPFDFEHMSVRSDKAFRHMHLNLIDIEQLSTLNDIAGVMIEGGYLEMLRREINRYSAKLASCFEILDINNILGNILGGRKEESKEILLKVWTMAMHVSVGFLTEMQRQLNGQDLGHFNILREGYFLAIAKQSIRKLLRAADFICIQIQGAPIDPVYMQTYTALKPDLSKMVNLVMMYQALNYSMPTILALLSGQTKELILAQGEGLIHRLSDMFVKLSVEQNDLMIARRLFLYLKNIVRRLDIYDTGVHPFTRHVMDHVRMLVQHESTVCLMLKGDLNAFYELVAQLISSLESMLDRNSKGLQLPGQQQIFLMNNVHFMLQEAKIEKHLGRILGEGWLLHRHDQLDMFIAGYVNTSWTPVISCVRRRTRVQEILWPADKFISLFETTYRVHKTWKVSDPLIRNKVREAIFHKVIPVYRMHMENYYSEKQQKPARYSIEQLESKLQELFEG